MRAASPSSRRDEDVHTAVERRLGELVGAVGREAAHRPLPQRSGGASTCGCTCGVAARAHRPAASPASAVLAEAAEAGRRHRRAVLHPPAAGAGGSAGASPARLRLDVAARRRAVRGCDRPHRRLAARRRRLGGQLAPARSGPSPVASTWPGSSTTRSMRWRHATSSPSTRSACAQAMVHLSPARRGAGAVVDGRVRLGDLRRPPHDRFVCAAAEEEPRHRRAGTGQGGNRHRRRHRAAGAAEGPAAGVQPRPPGGQACGVPRRRHAGARARGR